jgi:nucleotide-binding universal stress UspA family protein
MSRVLAAVDNSPGARPVLLTARAFAALLDADVYPVHVDQDDDRLAELAAEVAGRPLHRIPGPFIESLVKVGQADDVAAIVVGARRLIADPRPLGSTALTVATSVSKPVVVVPPGARIPETIRRVLLPVEGTPGSAHAPGLIAELARHGQPEIIAVHVKPELDLPAFTDQPQHEHRAWSQEFIRRYCDCPPDSLRLHTRLGRPDEQIPQVADQVDADIVVLAWSQNLNLGRARVVRAVLRRCRRPTLLMPVDATAPDEPDSDRSAAG